MRKVLVAVVGACLLALGLSTQAAHAQDVTVCPQDGNPASCQAYTTIQAAVDASPRNGVITLSAGVFTETITIDNKDLLIRGAGYSATIIQAARFPCGSDKPTRVFWISASRVKLQDLGIRFGCVVNQEQTAAGGGIWNSGALTLQRVVVANNVVVNNTVTPTVASDSTPIGGGIYNVGSLDLIESAVLLNSVTSAGNEAQGGGIYNNGRTNVLNSTIGLNRAAGANSEDEAGLGGGIFNAGKLVLDYATVARNAALTAGGGIYSKGDVEQVNSLIIDNSSPGGEAECYIPASGIRATATLTVIDPGCRTVGGTVGEIIDAGSGPFFLPPPEAVDAGTCILSRARTDQRGFPRAQGNECDLGSVEVGMTYAPLIAAAPPQPDLIVDSITVEPSANLDASTKVKVTVVIKNIGNEATMDTFYVDLFVNPRETPPNHGGTSWFQLCRNDGCSGERGVVWVINGSLDEGQSLTLTSELASDPYIYQRSTRWDKRFDAGEVALWAIVDSYQVNQLPSGRIAERNENNNRLAHPKFVVAPATLPTAAGDATLPQAAPVAPSVEP
jgi:hypothetical protein